MTCNSAVPAQMRTCSFLCKCHVLERSLCVPFCVPFVESSVLETWGDLFWVLWILLVFIVTKQKAKKRENIQHTC